MAEPDLTYLLVDGENIDGALGGILGRKPDPAQRPRWQQLVEFAEHRWQRPVRALFFINASRGMHAPFVQALIAMDYPTRQRLKIYGHARVAYAEDEPELVARLSLPDYEAVVQRAVVVSVAAFEWNCPQHITPRYTAAELEEPLAAMRQRIRQLEDENRRLTAAAREPEGPTRPSLRQESACPPTPRS